jgi:catechol 2,3-dioxygenase-like lactoylglutathione lyase family enzyme
MAFSFLYLAVRALFGVLLRSRRGLHVKDIELLVLRHELEILRRQVARPKPAAADRALLAAAACHLPCSSRSVLLVTPRTLLRWHQALVRRKWRQAAGPRGRPRLPAEVRQRVGQARLPGVADLRLTDLRKLDFWQPAEGDRMIDHVTANVSDLGRAKRFYEQALAPLGYSMQMEFQGATGFGTGEGIPDFWIGSSPDRGATHVAISAGDRLTVDKFYEAAPAAGGEDNGPPGLRPHYHETYYAAYVRDADGNNIEAVCHRPE